MLRMIQSRSVAQAASYYTQSLSTGDYYAKEQELGQDRIGQWHGQAAELLGLAGQDVTKESFLALVQNRHPVTGESLTPRTKENRTVGYDLNFHAPKSLSLLYAMTGDERIVQKFQQSVQRTMQELEADPLGSRYWRNAMYHELLDDWERIAELLIDHAVVGTHRRQHSEQPRIYPDGQSESPWHFAGTFFWFRNRDAFSTAKWRDVWQPTGWGAEAWPGRMFDFDQSACVAYDGLAECYDPESYDPQLEDEFDE